MSRFVEFKPEFFEKEISDLPNGGTGYRAIPGDDVAKEIQDAGIDLVEGSEFLRSLQSYSVPDVVNSLEYIKVKNQQSKGACAGFTVAWIAEFLHWVASGGETERFSGDAMYVLAQQKDGIRGDRGSTPTSCAWVMKNIGPIKESDYGPTVKTYNQLKPVTQSMKQNAGKYKVECVVRLRSYKDVKQFLGAGVGAIQMGSIWPAHFDARGSNLISSFHGPKRNDQHGGGHSYGLGGYDKQGNILLVNSWSPRWGDDGMKLLSPRAIDEMFQHNFTICLGYTDMGIKPKGPREFKFKASDWF